MANTYQNDEQANMEASESFIVVYHRGKADLVISDRLTDLGYEIDWTRLGPGLPKGEPFFRKSFDDKSGNVDSLLHEVIAYVVTLYSNENMTGLVPEIVVCWSPRRHQDSLIVRAEEIQQLAVLGGQVLVDTYNG